MTKLQIVSDVHLEFYSVKTIPTIIPCAENIALLGDIGKPFEDTYKLFLSQQSKNFKQVFVLMGNHEYYNCTKTVTMILEKAKIVCSSFPNVHLLDNSTYDLTEKTTLVGCTLWSLCDYQTSLRMNDFYKIHVDFYKNDLPETLKIRKPITIKMYNDWHIKDVAWLENNIKEQQKRNKQVIVLTHHAPLHVMNGKYVNSPIQSGFSSDLHHLFKPPVISFANGHIHSNCDVIENNIRCVSNAMGYPKEDTGYLENVVIDIP